MLIKSFYNCLKVFYADFMSPCSISYERGVLKSPTIIVDLSIFPFNSHHLLHVFQESLGPPDKFILTLLNLVFFLALKSTLSNINIATPAFFWLVRMEYLFLSLFRSLYLKWLSFGEQIVGHCFLSNMTVFVF